MAQSIKFVDVKNKRAYCPFCLTEFIIKVDPITKGQDLNQRCPHYIGHATVERRISVIHFRDAGPAPGGRPQ